MTLNYEVLQSPYRGLTAYVEAMEMLTITKRSVGAGNVAYVVHRRMSINLSEPESFPEGLQRSH